MQSTQTPTLIPLAFAANGTKNAIPEASQIGITNGAASLNDGFPPLTMTPIAAGGTPPSGADMNGILFLATSSIRWLHAGGLYSFNSAFAADTNVGGYPAGAELMSADLQGSWVSLNDNNTDNPDTGAGTKWVPGRAYGVTAVAGLTNANVTLTPAQAAKNKITLAGTLTGNIQIIFPTWLRSWEIVNNTTGSFNITCKTASGTGVIVTQGGVLSRIACDGTNIVQLNEQMNVAPATTGTNPVQMVQAQSGSMSYAVATGTANAHVIALTPALTARVDGMPIRYKSPGVNTGAVTLNDGLGAVSVVGAAHQALQGGEYAANGDALVYWNSSIGGGSYILAYCTGGAEQVPAATQSQHAVQLGQVGHGQCRLSVASATSLVLKPYNGNNVLVNGVPLALPSAGVSVSNSGLSASTLYYVYLAGTTASPSLVLSATGHVTASSGVEVMSGDATKTLVGMIVTNSSSQFSTNSLLCANWFNRRKLLGNALTSSVTTTSTSATKLTTALDISFLCWADDIPQQFICGNIANNTNSIITNVYGYIDGSQAGLAQNYAGTANFGAPYSLSNSLGLSEGMHTSSVYGSVSSSSTGTFSANHSVITNA